MGSASGAKVGRAGQGTSWMCGRASSDRGGSWKTTSEDSIQSAMERFDRLDESRLTWDEQGGFFAVDEAVGSDGGEVDELDRVDSSRRDGNHLERAVAVELGSKNVRKGHVLRHGRRRRGRLAMAMVVRGDPTRAGTEGRRETKLRPTRNPWRTGPRLDPLLTTWGGFRRQYIELCSPFCRASRDG